MSEQAVFDSLKYRIEVNEYGNRRYYNSAGYLHRNNGPAIVCSNGYKSWWQDGELHRIDGPAVEYAKGGNAWYINGKRLTEDEFNQVISQTKCLK